MYTHIGTRYPEATEGVPESNESEVVSIHGTESRVNRLALFFCLVSSFVAHKSDIN